MTPAHYKHFAVAIYTRVCEVNKMRDMNYLKDAFDIMSRQVKINKVYLETHRDLIVADEATIRAAKQYLEGRGVKVSGGITLTVLERNRAQTYCYTNPELRQKLKDISAFTARLFDEFILDDYFFTNCKCPSCITAKGEKSWTAFRMELLNQAARELILDPARAANPRVKVTVKYPNWYEYFQGLGFDLENQPHMFDSIYTGNETRDPVYSTQHLQHYESYGIQRYFENVKPGGNAGGWVDPFGSMRLDRYAEQLWLTLFAKAREVTLFDFNSIQQPIRPDHRAPWQGEGTSFNFDSATADWRNAAGDLTPQARITLAAGAAFEAADKVLGELGNPLGVLSYKPFHSTGEDFLHNYLGMLGIPIEMTPRFPTDAPTVLLTEAAKFDNDIVAKIKRQLLNGKTVVITSGLLKALQDRGIRDIVELQTSDRKATATDFQIVGNRKGHHAARPITVPQIGYMTNDSWEEISCMVGVTGTPLLHSAQYGNATLYILTIPDSYDDLYHLPAEVLTCIKEVVAGDLFVRLEGPAQATLFAYDNNTFIVESFLPETVNVRAVVDGRFGKLVDIVSGEEPPATPIAQDWRGRPTNKKGFTVSIKPHSFRVFRAI